MTFLTTQQVSERYSGKVSVRTLNNWRSLQTGPKFHKLGGRILYALSDLEKWEKERAANGTCQYTRQK